MVRAGISLPALQQLMGHAHIRTTMKGESPSGPLFPIGVPSVEEARTLREVRSAWNESLETLHRCSLP